MWLALSFLRAVSLPANKPLQSVISYYSRPQGDSLAPGSISSELGHIFNLLIRVNDQVNGVSVPFGFSGKTRGSIHGSGASHLAQDVVRVSSTSRCLQRKQPMAQGNHRFLEHNRLVYARAESKLVGMIGWVEEVELTNWRRSDVFGVFNEATTTHHIRVV